MAGRRRKPKQMPEMPVASFSDIAFLLLIFFILTTSFSKTQGFLSDLPSGEVAKTTKKGETPTVFVDIGSLKFNDQAITVDELRKRLKGLKLAEKEKQEDRIVIMESASGVDYETYFRAMSTITAAGGVIAIVKEE
jgi:biopolymer transport protein ExbD